MSALAIFGIRHHGPGSARSVERALHAFAPDVVLVEGPVEADAIVAFAARSAMQPPVAILAYVTSDPARAVFYPFAAFSPEWRALQFALRRGVPVRFMDLPLAIALASEEREHRMRDTRDALDEVAARAGFADGERWWDAFVERRRTARDAFAALEELMGVLRDGRAAGDDAGELRREAAMRATIRAAAKEYERIAVVCGAWHAPALRASSERADADILRDLPTVAVATTWIPWTHGRLALASGYGAGIESPGWYEHLYANQRDVVSHWMTKAARALRDADIDVAPAQAIDATRLADALASLRGASLPGLAEVTDAIGTVYCFGESAPLALVHERLVVGERIGAVPDDVTQIPLLADLARERKRLRLAPSAGATKLGLDLRKPNDLERSRLLTRLHLVGVPWGRPERVRDAIGTFREAWTLRWEPEFTLTLIEASASGSTIVAAAESRVRERAARARDLAELGDLLDGSLRAHVPAAIDDVLRRMADRAALTHDAGALLDALPPLARTLRYGDVRQTDAAAIRAVIDGAVARGCIALPVAARALDDDAAAAMYARIVAVDAALRTLDLGAQRASWEAALGTLAADDRVHGLVAGRALRVLFDGGGRDADDVRAALRLALGRGSDPVRAAAWLEGAFRDSGTVLVHQHGLLAAIDAWLVALDEQTFVALLPLVRRTFASFTVPERAALAARLAAAPDDAGASWPPAFVAPTGIDWERARLALPALASILGNDA